MPRGPSIPIQAHPGFRVTRRCAIQAGAVGLLGLGFNHLAALRALAAPAAKSPQARAKSVIYISSFLYHAEPIKGLM